MSASFAGSAVKKSPSLEGGKSLVFIGPAHPYRGGIAQFLQGLAGGLDERGHCVTTVTFRRQYPGILFPGKSQYVPDSKTDPFPAVRLIDTVCPLSWWKTARFILHKKPDAVIFQYWMPFFAPAFGLIARIVRRRTRIVAFVHNAIPHESRWGDRFLSRFFLNSCDALIVLSTTVAEEIHSLKVQKPIRQVGHPVYSNFGEALEKEEARAVLGLPRDVPVLLFFGLIRRYKGLHLLLEAMPLVLRSLPQARLIIAGEFYDKPQNTLDSIARYGLERQILLHSEFIPDEKVRIYFSSCDVVVQPYISASQSGVAQIAFHFDRPLIVTDVGSLAETVPHEKAGLVVPPEKPEALAKAICRFFESQMAEKLQKGVQEEKQKYSWEALYKALESVLIPAPV
ncbi:glycosyltransferase [candidate division KSB1 bacterium]|nr:glycosyltransferase [candidate division KSB1 bacterium]